MGNIPNLFEKEAKRKNVSVEQVKKDYKKLATLIMLRIENSDNQQLKDLKNQGRKIRGEKSGDGSKPLKKCE